MNDWHAGGDKETAGQIRREVTAAIKSGTLPERSKVTARTCDAAVDVNLVTEQPHKYFDRDARQLTEEGRDVASRLAQFVEPHMSKVDGTLSFLRVALDGQNFNLWSFAERR